MDVKDIKFKKVNAQDLKKYKDFYFLRDNKTCDSVVMESFIWKDYYNIRVAVVEKENKEVGLIWLMGEDNKEFSAMPICASEDLKYCFLLTKKYFNEVLNKKLVINIADAEAVKELELDEEEFLIKEEDDLRDYLYSGEKLRTLSGRKLHKKKNKLNKFIQNYEGRFYYKKLGCKDRDDIFRFLKKWREDRGEVLEGQLDPEIEGIHSVLLHCENLAISMAGVYIDDKLEAFSIASFNERHNMAVIHIEKATKSFDGLYQYINREFLCNEFSEVELVNREDDLGLLGLREAKLSYLPIDFARKYFVSQR